MPMPKPNPDESRDHFVKRCMANPTMNSEFSDNGQRFAVCNDIWRRHSSNRDVWDEVVDKLEDLTNGEKGEEK